MNSELFIIDLSNCSNTGEIITNVSSAFEIPNSQDRKIGLKLNNITLNQSQMLSIQSLIASYGSQLCKIQTSNEANAQVIRDMGIEVELIAPMQETPEVVEEIGFEIKKDEFSPLTPQESNVDLIDFNSTQQTPQKEEPQQEAQAQEVVQSSVSYEPDEDEEMPTYKKGWSESDEKTWEEVDCYAPPTDEPVKIDPKQTIYVNQTLRSGQVLEFDGNVVIIGDCHPGSEIIASGDITVWGVLGSIAHAGAKGNRDARIRALKMNAVQLRIANTYSRRPDGTNIPYIIKSSTFIPEEARIVDDSIVLFKIN